MNLDHEWTDGHTSHEWIRTDIWQVEVKEVNSQVKEYKIVKVNKCWMRIYEWEGDLRDYLRTINKHKMRSLYVNENMEKNKKQV